MMCTAGLVVKPRLCINLLLIQISLSTTFWLPSVQSGAGVGHALCEAGRIVCIKLQSARSRLYPSQTWQMKRQGLLSASFQGVAFSLQKFAQDRHNSYVFRRNLTWILPELRRIPNDFRLFESHCKPQNSWVFSRECVEISEIFWDKNSESRALIWNRFLP